MVSTLILRAIVPSLRSISPRSLSTSSKALLFRRQYSMATSTEFKQAPHKLLVIPGPVEVSDEVLFANAHPSVSHNSPDLIRIFGDCLRMIRTVLFTKDAQPFFISGSGTLGWDQVAANLVEPGEDVLVLQSGYFGDGFADCLRIYGARVDQIKAELGTAVGQPEIEKALTAKKYKLVAFTHVDTSTGVMADAKLVAETVKRVSPDALIVMDAICSVASEEIRFDQWGLDVVITASQKGLGSPPGLSIVLASQRAIKVYETRSTPVTSYYGSWQKWLPIMKAYESGVPSYFATPPVNLIHAFHRSLLQITEGPITLEDRFKLHRQASKRIKDAASDLGLKQIPLDPAFAANGMTTLYFPDGLGASDLLPRFSQRGIMIAAGLCAGIKDKYFRIGHMGITAVDTSRGDIDSIIKALKESIAEAKSQRT